MRSWEASISFVFFSLSAVVGIFAVVQLITLPFRGAGSREVDLSELQMFQLMRLEPIEVYQKDFSVHALFSKPKAPVVAKGPDFSEIIKPYVLTGIVQGAEPEALIQNTVTKQTFWVQAGEQFDRFKLIQIKSHSVIVEFQGERKELYIEGGLQ